MNTEKMIFDIVAASRSNSQKGDLGDLLGDIISPEQKKTLKNRDKLLSGGNPIDIKNKIK